MAIDRLIRDDVVADFDAAFSNCRQLISLVKLHVSKQLEPFFNTELQKKPQATYVEKKALTHYANGTLRELGLAIRDPVLNEPAILTADPGSGGRESVSRFRLKSGYSAGKERTTKSSTKLWPLELMPDSPRKEGLAIRHQNRLEEHRR